MMSSISSKNSHYAWNSKHSDLQMPHDDIVYFNIVKADPGRDAFKFSSHKLPNTILNAESIQMFSNPQLYASCDIAEIIRSDFSRLFFDIDVDNGVFTPEELEYTLNQIKDILSILKISFDNLYGVIETTTRKNISQYISNWTSTFHNLLIIPTPFNEKEFSAHFYVSGYYFPRNDLFDLFSQGKNHYCKDPEINNHLSSYIDQSVYVSQGSQKVFRFCLSGKAIKHRRAPPFTQEQLTFVSTHLDKFVCTKTSSDMNIISSSSPEFQTLKAYLDQFKGRNAQRDTRRISKKDLEDELIEDIFAHEKISKKYIAKQTAHTEWYHSLILQVKNYLVSKSDATDEELFNFFSQEEYQYFSNSNNRRLYQPSSIRDAIREARLNPHISIEDIIDLSEMKAEEDFYNVNNSIHYTIEQFKATVERIDGVSIPEFCKLLHFTFAFFCRSDSEKKSVLQILYTQTQNKKIVIVGYEEFMKMLKPYPINVRLLRQIKKVDNRCKPPKEETIQIIQTISLITAFNLFDKYKQRFYDFRLCAKSDTQKYFSLYSKPTTAPETPLPSGIDTILNILASELSEETNSNSPLFINQEKKNYILDWFAYLLQHPDSRNAVCLQISTVQGVGKNLLSNAVCDYLGSFFSEPSKDIDKVIGTYNGGIDNKLLIVMNEVDNSKKNTDLLKAIITEDTIQINVKYGLQYTGKNCANYLIYTNHIDTNTISNGDRRFTFIKSYGVPMPKEFYASICIPGKEGHLKEEIRNQFIKHLLSRDLSNYKPNEPKAFDKHIIEDKRQEARSSIHKCLISLLTSQEYTKDFILVSDFINDIQNVLISPPGSNFLFNKYQVPALQGIDDEIKAEIQNTKKAFTAQALGSIVNFNDDDVIEKIKSKRRDETRDKQIIRLRKPKGVDTSIFISQQPQQPQMPQFVGHSSSQQPQQPQMPQFVGHSSSQQPQQPQIQFIDPFSKEKQNITLSQPQKKRTTTKKPSHPQVSFESNESTELSQADIDYINSFNL